MKSATEVVNSGEVFPSSGVNCWVYCIVRWGGGAKYYEK